MKKEKEEKTKQKIEGVGGWVIFKRVGTKELGDVFAKYRDDIELGKVIDAKGRKRLRKGDIFVYLREKRIVFTIEYEEFFAIKDSDIIAKVNYYKPKL